MPSNNVYGTLANGDSVALTEGKVVRVDATNTVVRAQADSEGHLQGLAGVVITGHAGPGAPAVAVTSTAFGQRVLCESGLTLAAGDTLYVSDTVPGRATNIAPTVAVAVATIADLAQYADDDKVIAIVDIAVSASTGGGVFPGFGPAPPAIGPSTAGASGLASRSDHTHPELTVDGILTGTTQLSTLASASYSVNAVAWVTTVGAPFKLQQSALTVDNITVVTATGKAGYQWVRQLEYNASWSVVTTWYLDPQNVIASDEAAGTIGAPLKTAQELARRVYGSVWLSARTFNVLSSLQVGDSAFFNIRIIGTTLTIAGTPATPIYTGTVTSYTPCALAAAADDNQLVDSTIPVSFTASGLLADGLLFTRTNSTPLYWWGAKDLGSKTLRTSAVTASSTPTSLNPGDTYSVSSLPNVYALRFPANTGAFGAAITFRQLRINYEFTSEANVFYDRCSWPGSPTIPTVAMTGRVCRNCSWGSSFNLYSTGSHGVLVMNAGLVRGDDGPSAITSAAGGCQLQLADTVFQGCRLSCGQQANIWIVARISIYDCSSDMLRLRDQANVLISDASSTGSYGIGGKGNTSYITILQRQALLTYQGAAPFVAGTTTLSNPIQIAVRDYAVSALPVLDITTATGVVRYDGNLGLLWSNDAITASKRLEYGKGANAAVAVTQTLDAGGNLFTLTGTGTVQGITTSGWQAGSVMRLVIPAGVTVVHNSGAPGAGAAAILLSTGEDLFTATNTLLTLTYDGTVWYGAVPGGVAGGLRSFITAEFDFAATPTGIVLVPALPGYYAFPISASWFMTVGTGTCTLADSFKAGNNGATRTNMLIAQAMSTVAVINQTITAGAPVRGGASTVVTGQATVGAGPALADLTNPILLDVTVAATGTGGFTFRGQVEVLVHLRKA